MCTECCEDCCRNCCYSTPYVTLSGVGLTVIGLVGFALAGLYGVASMNSVEELKDGTVVMAPIIVGMVVLTLLPLVQAAIMGYCVTGYIRDVLFQRTVKKYIGSLCCNAFIMVSILVFIFLWLLLAIGFGGVMVYYAQAEIFCNQPTISGVASSGMNVTEPDCFPLVGSGFSLRQICPDSGLEDFCRDALPVGAAFSVTLIFIVIIILGLAVLMSVVSANRISAMDNLDYRSANKNDFSLKPVR